MTEPRPILELLAAAIDAAQAEADRAAAARPAAALPPRIVCPVCGSRSTNPGDIEHGYCGHCHRFTSIRPGNTPGPVS